MRILIMVCLTFGQSVALKLNSTHCLFTSFDFIFGKSCQNQRRKGFISFELYVSKHVTPCGLDVNLSTSWVEHETAVFQALIEWRRTKSFSCSDPTLLRPNDLSKPCRSVIAFSISFFSIFPFFVFFFLLFIFFIRDFKRFQRFIVQLTVGHLSSWLIRPSWVRTP